MIVVMNMLKEKVFNTVSSNQLVKKGDRILACLSGGADSVALLSMLKDLSSTLEIELVACHVNHHIRKETAKKDAEHAEQIAKQLGVLFVLEEVDVLPFQEKNGLSLEEAARILRYQAFEKAATEYHCNKIALAHHLDDQAETVLFNLVRGSGLRGLSGMHYMRDEKFIRPLLDCRREEIEAYLQEVGLAYVTDETNLSDDYTRNAIRLHVMPALRKIRPQVAEKIKETAAYLGEVDDYFVSEAKAFLQNESQQNVLKTDQFNTLPFILQEYVLRTFLSQNGIPLKDIGRVQIDQMVALAKLPVGKKWSNEKGISLEKTYDAIVLNTLPKEKKSHLHWEMICTNIPYEKGMIIPQEVYTKWIDCDKIKTPLSLRTRKSEDVFSTYPNTHKKLKDYLIDEKIPKEERENLALVADGNEIVWVIGYRLNENYKVTENTKTIMKIEVREVE